MAKYQQGFPVNENGEIVTSTGSGSRNITGVLPIDQLAVSDTGECLFAPQAKFSQVIASNYNPAVRLSVGDATDTNFVTLATINVPANVMGPNGQLKIYFFGTSTTTGTKTFAIDVGGSNIAAPSLSGANVVVGWQGYFCNIGASNQNKITNIGSSPFGATSNAVLSSSVNTGVPFTIVIRVKWGAAAGAAGADNITLSGYTVEAVYAP
jgi:hypothetical protein